MRGRRAQFHEIQIFYKPYWLLSQTVLSPVTAKALPSHPPDAIFFQSPFRIPRNLQTWPGPRSPTPQERPALLPPSLWDFERKVSRWLLPTGHPPTHHHLYRLQYLPLPLGSPCSSPNLILGCSPECN